MIYRCKKTFNINLVDDDYMGTNKYKTIRKGSKWEENGHKMFLDGLGLGAVHLDSINSTYWIEISRKALEECFDEVK